MKPLIIKMYLEGSSVVEIERFTGLNNTYIYRTLRDANVLKKQTYIKIKTDKENLEYIFNEILRGVNFKDLAKEYKVLPRTMMNFYRKHFKNVVRKEFRNVVAKNNYVGYTKEESTKIRKFLRNNYKGQLLDIVECRCTEHRKCFPCFLNEERKMVS